MATVEIDGPTPLPKSAVCKKCHRMLVDPESILYEMGPVCRAKSGIIVKAGRVHKDEPKVRKRVRSPVASKEGLENLFPNFNLESWFESEEKKI